MTFAVGSLCQVWPEESSLPCYATGDRSGSAGVGGADEFVNVREGTMNRKERHENVIAVDNGREAIIGRSWAQDRSAGLGESRLPTRRDFLVRSSGATAAFAGIAAGIPLGAGTAHAVRTEYTVFALSPDKNGVYHYHDERWIPIGGPAAQLYGGDWGLVATSPGNADLWRYLNSPGQWQRIGGPGASFAVTKDSVFGLSPDKNGVYRNGGTSWTKVGGPAGQIYGGSWGLVATSPGNADLWRYLNSPGQWQRIGGPGASFAVTNDSVYGLSTNPNGGGVYRYDGQGMSWTKVGGPAGQIYGGDWGLVATNPSNGDLYGYQYHGPEDNPAPPVWEHIGGPGASFAVSYETVFGLSTNPNGGGVYRYDGRGTSWTKVGGPAHSIVAALWLSR
jgi:hypothetical protein